jgi:hypothetical protein
MPQTRAGKDSHLRRKYGISLDEYELMLSDQGNVCAICKENAQQKQCLGVDHCHETNQVRGILCSRCNSLLGRSTDDSNLLRSAATYLDRAQNLDWNRCR